MAKKKKKKTIADFRRAARQRLSAARQLLKSADAEHYLDAIYLGGYVAECALKALILRGTPTAGQQAQFEKFSRGKEGHNPDTLAVILIGQGRNIPLAIVKLIRQIVAEWQSELRYHVGRRAKNDTAAFLNDAEQIRNWVERSW